jgi:hypothetical protein
VLSTTAFLEDWKSFTVKKGIVYYAEEFFCEMALQQQ